ncbi:MAG TPA: MoxR family ATPase [Thermoprotei archaeon]|nr:MoxR family ATPase [Thermoprotei archaeon]
MDLTFVSDNWRRVYNHLNKVVVGMDETKEELFAALVSTGHILLEGPPGIAKTTLAKTFANLLDLEFSRIQFTPDLLPADIIGTKVYNQKTGEFETRLGPIYSNIVLADEINRASPKTQSALLEAMQERQVTIEGELYKIPEPFMVIATQNPIEIEGTYPLPIAQLDRFMFKSHVGYPNRDEYIEILSIHGGIEKESLKSILNKDQVLSMRRALDRVTVSKDMKNYVVDVIDTISRDNRLEWGISPRAALHLIYASKAYALMNGRDYVAPEDVKRMVYPVLNHRILLSTEAHFRGVTPKDIIEESLRKVRVPI